MLPDRKRPEKGPGSLASHAGAEELVDLDDHGVRHEEIAPELRDQSRGQTEGGVAPIRGRDERRRVGDDFQRMVTSSRK